MSVRLNHMKLLTISPFGSTKALISCSSTYSFVSQLSLRVWWTKQSCAKPYSSLKQKVKSVPLCCTARLGIVDEKPLARGQGHTEGDRIIICFFFFYTLATANLIRASALRGSLLGTHSLYRPPRGSYLNPFNFLTCTWMTLCMKILSLCCLQSNTTL